MDSSLGFLSVKPLLQIVAEAQEHKQAKVGWSHSPDWTSSCVPTFTTMQD